VDWRKAAEVNKGPRVHIL